MDLITLHKKTLPAFHKIKQSLMILGAPGMGKTDCFMDFGASMSVRLGKPFAVATAIVSGVDPVDLRGVFIPMKQDGTNIAIVRSTLPAIWPTEYNIEVFIDGKLDPDYNGPVPEDGSLFFDEYSQADADIQKVSAQILLARRIGEHALPPGWSVFAAGNRVEDRAGTTKMLSHVQNRMCQIEVAPDYEAWQKWAFDHNIHPLTIGFAKAHAGEVFRLSVPKEPGPFCTPRSLVMTTNVLVSLRTPNMGELELPDDADAASIIKGYLGEGVLPKFMSHIRLANNLPELEEIVSKPTETKVPDRLDARFVLATSLAVHAKNTEKLRPILKYISRMDVELQTLFVQGVVARNPQALTVSEFSAWVQKNQKLILATNR